jgi:hypothetical protein
MSLENAEIVNKVQGEWIGEANWLVEYAPVESAGSCSSRGEWRDE